MLLDRAIGLAEKINRYKALKEAASQAEAFRTRANQFREARTILVEARTALDRFRGAGVPVEFVASNTDTLRDKVTELKALMAANPAVLADPPYNLKYVLIDRLLSIGTSAKTAIDGGWLAYATEHGPAGSIEVLDALSKLEQFQASVARIRLFRQTADELARKTPTDPKKAVESLELLTAGHRQAWAELNADGIPATVILFLRGCASRGVPLSDLSDEVVGWLKARELLGSFRIRIG
jgi:hypothetical protein